MLKTLAVIIAVLLCCPSTAAPPTPPENVQSYLDVATSGYELPEGEFEPYLKSYFEEQAQAEPWAVEGDFNGDNISDWAGLLRNRDSRIDLLVVYSVEDEYVHSVLATLGADENGIYFGVVLEPAGEVHGFPLDDDEPDPVVTLRNPGVHLIYYEKSSVLYYWDNGKFREFWTSD